MFFRASLAHTKQTDLRMLDCKWFISEFSSVNWSSSLRSFVNFDLSTLDKHASVYAANFWLVIAYKLSICLLEAFAETHKVFNSFWSNVCKQLISNSVSLLLERKIHECIFSCFLFINCLEVCLFSTFYVDLSSSIVSVLERKEGIV